jgi:hypothetical protein
VFNLTWLKPSAEFRHAQLHITLLYQLARNNVQQ